MRREEPQETLHREEAKGILTEEKAQETPKKRVPQEAKKDRAQETPKRKESQRARKDNSLEIPQKEEGSSDEGPRQIYDRIFKRIFSLSDKAVISLINGLFEKDFPLDSAVWYPNREFVLPGLEERLADVIVVIGGVHAFHLEAQMTKDEMIVLRAFEYSFQYGLSAGSGPDRLEFPDIAVIYLDQERGLPEESVLHITFGSQGSFDYHVRNCLYLSHDAQELDRRKMIVLIPFQTLRLRSLVKQWKEAMEKGKPFDEEKFYRLQEEIRNDIIGSIEKNLKAGNITADDARQLTELTNRLHRHICRDVAKKQGGEEGMKPLLPGALELPNDKYRFRIDELERQIEQYRDENARYADENARYADENAKYADENARYADENARLKEKIAQLEARMGKSYL